MTITDGGVIALGVFVAGLIFDAGRKAEQLTTVKRDVNRLYAELRAIRPALEKIATAVQPMGDVRDID